MVEDDTKLGSRWQLGALALVILWVVAVMFAGGWTMVEIGWQGNQILLSILALLLVVIVPFVVLRRRGRSATPSQ